MEYMRGDIRRLVTKIRQDDINSLNAEDKDENYNVNIEYYDIPSEILDIIMVYTIKLDPLYALMLAFTNKVERKRYIKLAENKLIYREVWILGHENLDLVFGNNGNFVIKGEKGYDHFKKENEKHINKLVRDEYIKPMKKKEKSLKSREHNYLKCLWKKGEY